MNDGQLSANSLRSNEIQISAKGLALEGVESFSL
jgi:hypothetical protein